MLSLFAQSSRDQTLDMFRAISVIMVVLFHYTARLPVHELGGEASQNLVVSFGWIGVYTFFILSGYCIFFTLGRSSSLISFFAKRFSRIYPAFFAAAVILFVIGQFYPLPHLPEYDFHEASPTVVDLIGNLFFLGGIFEWVNGSFWSITVEIQFYVIIGLATLMTSDRQVLARNFAYFSLAIGLVWVLLMLLSGQFAAFSLFAKVMQKLAIAPFLPFFALGVLGVQFASKHGDQKQFYRLFVQLSIVGAMVILMMQVGIEHDQSLSQAFATCVLMLAMIVVFAIYCAGWRMPSFPYFSSAMAQIGLLSFSWYLLHENLGVLIISSFAPHVHYLVAVGVAIAATFAAAIAFSWCVEWRFRKLAEMCFENALAGMATIMSRKKKGDSPV